MTRDFVGRTNNFAGFPVVVSKWTDYYAASQDKINTSCVVLPLESCPIGTEIAGFPAKFAGRTYRMRSPTTVRLLSPHFKTSGWIGGAVIGVVGVTIKSTVSNTLFRCTINRVRTFIACIKEQIIVDVFLFWREWAVQISLINVNSSEYNAKAY